MRFFISLLLAMAVTPVLAQAPHAQDAPVYVVSYIEVAPTAGGTAAGGTAPAGGAGLGGAAGADQGEGGASDGGVSQGGAH